jgi:glutamate-1-semialdehyde aminotransferase
VAAAAEQAARGITLMLPVEDSVWVGEELARRFGVPFWQFCLTATDANRFTIRLGPGEHRTTEDPCLQLVLSRHGGRDVHRARKGPAPLASRERWPGR